QLAPEPRRGPHPVGGHGALDGALARRPSVAAGIPAGALERRDSRAAPALPHGAAAGRRARPVRPAPPDARRRSARRPAAGIVPRERPAPLPLRAVRDDRAHREPLPARLHDPDARPPGAVLLAVRRSARPVAVSAGRPAAGSMGVFLAVEACPGAVLPDLRVRGLLDALRERRPVARRGPRPRPSPSAESGALGAARRLVGLRGGGPPGAVRRDRVGGGGARVRVPARVVLARRPPRDPARGAGVPRRELSAVPNLLPER